MSCWKILRKLRIRRGLQCRQCHADLRLVATCGLPDCPRPAARPAKRPRTTAVFCGYGALFFAEKKSFWWVLTGRG